MTTSQHTVHPHPPSETNSTSNTMSSSENAAGSVDNISGSEQPQSLTGEPITTPEAAQTGHDFIRKSHHLKKTNKSLISVDNLTDKQVEIVAKLNKHSNLIVNIILFAAVILIAWALYEMGYLGSKYTPTKCI